MKSSHSNVLASLAILFLFVATPTSGGKQEKLFTKIIGSQVAGGHLKIITPVHGRTSVKQACFAACLQTTKCEFVCYTPDELTCYLYGFYVSLYWKGDASGRNFSRCYSSWGRQDNVIRPNMTTTNSGLYSSSYRSEYMIDGFAYVGSSSNGCFLSDHETHSYWQVDLGTPVRVKRLTVTSGYYEYFMNVDMRLGNSSTHMNNHVIASVAASSSYSSMSIIVEAYTGRYLALSNQNAGYLMACGLQVHQE